jgi:hypothetical protein
VDPVVADTRGPTTPGRAEGGTGLEPDSSASAARHAASKSPTRIALTLVLALSLLGDAVRDAFDPRTRR